MKLQYRISHKATKKEDPTVIREEIEITIPAFVNNKRNPERDHLLEMMNRSITNPTPLQLKYILPKFIKVTNKGTAKPYALMIPVPSKIFKQYIVQ